MIRPFNLRDLTLVHRLREHGVMLQAEAALTTIPHPTRRALINMLLGGHFATYIWKSDAADSVGVAVGVAQIRWDEKNTNARLAYLGVEQQEVPESQQQVVDEDAWLSFIDQLVVEAGKKGVHHLIAEAAEDGPELPILRKAGFAVYTRQDIWISDVFGEQEAAGVLVPQQSVDEWDIQVLYANIVPGLIQSVEPNPPVECGKNWVLREEGELVAFAHVNRGPVAGWLRLLIHPNARTKPRTIISAALAAADPSQDYPIYCCVRRYQSWLQGPLEKAGFRWWGSQAVLVKHIVQPVKMRVGVKSSAWEPQPVPGSPPLVQGFSHHNGGGKGPAS